MGTTVSFHMLSAANGVVSFLNAVCHAFLLSVFVHQNNASRLADGSNRVKENVSDVLYLVIALL